MAITYALYLDAARSPAEVLDHVKSTLDVTLKTSVDQGVHQTTAIDGLLVSARIVDAPVDQYIHEDHGLRPRVRVSMRLDKEQISTGEDGVVNVLSAFALRCRSNAVLLREDESVAYRRVDGQVEFGEDPLWRSPERRARIEG